MKFQRRLRMGALIGAILFAGSIMWYACSSSTSPSTAGSGTMNMYLADAPAGYDSVVVAVIGVEVLMSGNDSSNGWTVVRPNADSVKFDLLVLRNGARAVLASNVLLPGHYTQIRLILGPGSYVVVSGVKYPLTIPSGMQTGIKLNHEFDIVAGQTYELLLDFDADRSIHVTGNGKYMMNPVIRLAVVAATGSIAGAIDPASANTLVWTTMGADTVETVADHSSGAFVLSGLINQTYAIHCEPEDTTFRDTILTGIAVAIQQQTAVGTVVLRRR